MRLLTAALLMLPPVPAPAPAPVFRDGFESPAAVGQFQRFGAGSRLGPWTVTAGDVDLSTTRLWQTPEGRQNLDLDGDVDGTVSATFPVRPLTTYRISFSLAGNPAAGPRVKTGEVRVDGRTALPFRFDTSLTSLSRMAFTTRTLYVFALTRQLRLDFASTTRPAGWGPVIDDVRVDSCLVVLCPTAEAAQTTAAQTTAAQTTAARTKEARTEATRNEATRTEATRTEATRPH